MHGNRTARRTRRALLVGAAMLATALAGAGPAAAGSISVVAGVPTFVAGFGEANAVEVWGDPFGVVFRDTGVPLTAGGGCTQVDPATVFCPVAVDGNVSVDLGDGADDFRRNPMGGPPPMNSFLVEAGDGADSVNLAGITRPATVDGGPGEDDIVGGEAGDGLDGGADNDVVDSGTGGPVFPEDSVNGGAGHDILRLRPLRGGVHGGDGFDTVDFQAQTADIYVEIGAFSGPEGSRFQFVGADVEAIWAGSGDDVLVGDDNRNAFWGNAGQDVLVGFGGDDFFDVDDGERDELYCGAGTDEVSGDGEDAVGGDCELVDDGGATPPENDDFAAAAALDGAVPPYPASNVRATLEPGEPAHADAPGGASVWFTWTPSFTGIAFVSTAGSNFDTLLGVYTGGAVGSLTTVAGNDDATPGDSTSEACFQAAAGTPYAVAADGFAAGAGYPGGLGGVRLTWGEYTSGDPCAIRPPTVTGNATVGGLLTASPGTWAGSPAGFEYQWLACDGVLDCALIPDATGSAYTVDAQDVDLGLGVRVVALHGSDPTRNALGYSALTDPVPAPPPPPPPPSGGGGGGGATDLTVTGSVSPPQAAVGASHVWRFRVANAGGGIAFGVVVDLELSANLAYGFSQVTRGSGCVATGERRFRCNLDLLGPSGDASSVGELIVGTNVVAAGEVSITATAAYSEPDPTPAGNVLTLRANTPTTPPPTPPPAPAPRGVTRVGTARADVLRGTAYADTLRGLGGADRLFGLGGADRLFGGPGADVVTAGTGADLVEGGGGNDRLLTRDGIADTVRCGLGRDVVEADRRDRVARDCEVVRRR